MEACELDLFFENYKRTFLPDLYLFFTTTPGAGGVQMMVSFLRVFEGCEIRMPKLDELKNLHRDVRIFTALNSTIGQPEKTKEARQLAHDFNLSVAEVHKNHARMRPKAPTTKKEGTK